MAITLAVAANKFPDNVALATTSAAMVTWFGTLTITTIYSITVTHYKGFFEVMIMYA